MPKVALISLGCKVNQYESEAIAKKLVDAGFDVEFGFCNDADVFVLNTCAVTNEAERKSRGLITKALRRNPNAKLYVAGCSSQNDPGSFEKRRNVKAVYGTARKTDLADMIIDNYRGELHPCNAIPTEYEEVGQILPSHTRAYLKIQDGCNNFCSYCLIPFLRGRSRSREIDKIKAEIDALSTNANEIVITGINISAYGEDLKEKLSLIDVADLFLGKSVRFRFSSFEVSIIDKEFLRRLSKNPNFCDHFHLSMQSGSDETLKSMNRHYTSSIFLSKIELIRKFFPKAGITTDVIVGFPTETEEQFKETMETCEKAKFSDMHIFPYSPRQGTAAMNLKNVARNVGERVERLVKLRQKMKENFIFSCLCDTMEVLVEEKRTEEGLYTGHTRNFIKCYIESAKPIEPNTFVKVKLNSIFEDGALCEIVDD